MKLTVPKAVLWALAGLLALLFIAVIAAELVSWNFLKEPIRQRAEAATGREFQINGDVEVNLLPLPHLVLEEVALANGQWARTPEMLTASRLEVTPSLTNLVRGKLVLDNLTVTDPTLNLENRDQKPGNWVLPTTTSPDNPGEGSAESQGGPPIVIHDIELSDAEITYLAPGMERPHVLSLSSVAVSGDRVSLQAEATLAMGSERVTVPLELTGKASLGYASGQWQLSELDVQVGGTHVAGSIGLDTDADPPALTGELHSSSVNVTNILEAMPASPEPTGSQGLSVPVLPNLVGDLNITVDQLIWEPMTVSNLEAHFSPGQHTLTLETLRFTIAKGTVEGTASLTSNADVVAAEARIRLQEIAPQEDHRLNGELALNLGEVQQADSLDYQALLNQLDIKTGQASYRSGQEDTDLNLTLDESGDPPAPVVSASGQFQGKSLEMTIRGAPLSALADGLANYPLQAEARSGQLFAWADTRLGALLTPETFTGNLVLEGRNGQDLDRWINPSLPPLPDFRLVGQLSRDQDRWSVTSLEGAIGSTELAGEVHFRNGAPPMISLDLDAGRIEIAEFTANEEDTADDEAGAESDSRTQATPDSESDRESPLAVLNTFNGQMNLSADTLVLPDGPALGDVQLTGQLEGGQAHVETVRFEVANGSWNSTLNLNASSQPASGALDATFNGISLSEFGDTFTTVEDRLGKLSGELHLNLTETLAADWQGDLLLPYLGQLIVEPSWLRFTDSQADTDMTLELETRDSDSGNQAFHIDGSGQYDGAPFSLRFRGDPLLDARIPDRQYSLELTSDVVDSYLQVQGTISQPLAMKGLDLGLELEGPDPQRLSRLLGIPLPELPPYSVSGDLTLRDQRWRVTNIAGMVGDSDLNGSIMFDADSRPPFLSADLTSTSLDLKDLGGLVGAEPEPTNPESASPDPSNAETQDASAADGDVLPDQPLATPAWQNLTADVRYRGDSVRAEGIPLEDVVIDFKLANGHAQFDPVRFGIGGGRVDFNLELDTKADPPEGTLELEVQSVNLREALDNWALANNSVGTVAAQGKFWVTGASIAELLASADGGLVLLMTQGKLDALLVELAGLDLAQSFLSWIRARDPIPIDCTYADVQSRNGVATIDTLAIDTPDTSFTGTGTIDLQSEKLDITLYAHPKDVSIFSARTPFHIGGTFSDIDPGLHEGGLVLRAGGSAMLAAVAGPVAALLPLLDLGTGDNIPYCQGLASRSLEAIGGPGDDREYDSDED